MFELMPYDASNSLRRLRQDMDELWSRFFEAPGLPSMKDAAAFVPAVDIKETKDAFIVTAEIPGMKAEDIDVSLTGDLLTIKGEKKEEVEKEEGDYHLVERRYGSFQRTFRLPKEVDRKKLKAKHKNGVLYVTLPKGEKEGSTTVKVEAG